MSKNQNGEILQAFGKIQAFRNQEGNSGKLKTILNIINCIHNSNALADFLSNIVG